MPRDRIGVKELVVVAEVVYTRWWDRRTSASGFDSGQRRGNAQIFGENWPALSAEGTPIEVGTEVRIVELRGATLVVEPAHAPALPGAPEGSDHPDPDDPGQ